MNPPPTWRLIVTPPAAGAWNMAVDEAIASHAGRGDVPPTLRFYQWQPACVSLGRHQPLADIDLARCARLGYDLVRRPTGGRAILHTDELTYSVAGPQEDPILAGAVLDSYLRLSQGLLAGLERLGLHVAKAPPTGRATADAGPVCFEVPSAYEIVVPTGRSSSEAYQNRRSSSEAYRDHQSSSEAHQNRRSSSEAYRDHQSSSEAHQNRRSSSEAYRDHQSSSEAHQNRRSNSDTYRDRRSSSEAYRDPKKLVGSAQSRRSGWVLQHGTLPLVGDVTRLVEVVIFPDEGERALQRQLLAGRAVTVQDALGRVVSFDEAAQALAAGFQEALGIRLELGELTAGELAAAGELQRSVYGDEGWTGRH